MSPEPPAVPLNGLGSSDQAMVAPTGRFRIYVGSAAGVGKTFAMLEEGQRRRDRGRDVAIGFVETHQRIHTAECIDGLEVIPRKQVEYRGSHFEEMDLDAVLARRPQLALVDELAHTNVPGSGRHAKRWEDVLEILDAGISVISTVNVQHLESLAESVEAMTGTQVRERVPDWVVRRADQLELVDSSPEQLRRRMVHGNVYPPEQVPAALSHFFSIRNLTILRELSLRFVADETEEALIREEDEEEPERALETTERILVGVSARPRSEHLLRRAARVAARVKCDLQALHVVLEDGAQGGGEREALARLELLAADLGAKWISRRGEDVAEALVHYAKEQSITELLVGGQLRRGWRPLGGGTLQRILKLAAEAGLDVQVISLDRGSPREVTEGGRGERPGASS